MYGHRLIMNHKTGAGKLEFVATEDVSVHLHAPEYVPSLIEGDIKEKVLYGSVKEIIISVIEMVNDRTTADVSISHRQCRFPWEVVQDDGPKSVFKFYDYSICMIKCAEDIQRKYCNCIHHLMPTEGEGILVYTFIQLTNYCIGNATTVSFTLDFNFRTEDLRLPWIDVFDTEFWLDF